MSSDSTVRLAALAATVWLSAAGCGASPSNAVPDCAPRRLQVPATIRPIRSETSLNHTADKTHSAPARYEQPPSPQPRITKLNPSTQPATGGSIREPSSAPIEVAAVPPSAPRRSDFVPIAMPETSPTPEQSPIPDLNTQPIFTAPAAPSSAPQLAVTSKPASPSPPPPAT